MASSRIFVKGLPPTLAEADFKSHFSATGEVKDAKIYPNRRIGFVGYETAEDAAKAVKYFNKTFIRMSRLHVEVARTPRESKALEVQHNPNHEDLRPTSTKRKWDGEPGEKQERDPQLQEYLDTVRPKARKLGWQDDAPVNAEIQSAGALNAATGDQSDEEYEDLTKSSESKKRVPDEQPILAEDNTPKAGEEAAPVATDAAVSDQDWARSRTSRLLGLLDDDEAAPRALAKDDEASDGESEKGTAKEHAETAPQNAMPTPPSDVEENEPAEVAVDDTLTGVRASMRLFVRNLPYDVKEADLETEFEPFGNLEEVHIAVDKKTGAAKGFAFIQFSDPDSAETALREKDGTTFSGRLIHVLPGKAKQDNKLDEFALAKLPLKQQQLIKKKRETSSKMFNWNALYMNTDAVLSSVADRLGLPKSEILDPTSSDAAVKQAHAETHVIQETKAYFKQHGVDLDAFKKKQRGDTAILVKNIPYDCSQDELKRRFEEHGELTKFLLPPSKTTAIVEFANAAQCKTAFDALAYRRIKSSMLFLEKAPKGLFDGQMANSNDEVPANPAKPSASDLKDSEHIADGTGRSTLYVRNLNFKTSTTEFAEAFKYLDGFSTAVVKTKADPKNPNAALSMGFGFVEFKSTQDAQKALQMMDGHELDGHKLQIRASHRGVDAAEQRRIADVEKRAAGKHTKIIIKNLPFEATKKDVRALFSAYGQLRSVRVPKKMDRAARGFAFADFVTPKEAENAMEALRHTHLLGRRLVLDFAAEDAEDAEAEIEKMQRKVGAQVNKVALQKLTSGGRKKFSTQNDEEDNDD